MHCRPALPTCLAPLRYNDINVYILIRAAAASVHLAAVSLSSTGPRSSQPRSSVRPDLTPDWATLPRRCARSCRGGPVGRAEPCRTCRLFMGRLNCDSSTARRFSSAAELLWETRTNALINDLALHESHRHGNENKAQETAVRELQRMGGFSAQRGAEGVTGKR